jgi:CheY-like chemotaxis protein
MWLWHRAGVDYANVMHVGTKTVLIVDDDDDLREAMADLLRLRGFNVIQAANGREALERLTAGLPGVILLDMKMPIMNGWEFAAAFRDKYDDAAPIIVLTAAADAQARAIENGADGWLCKPFDTADLYSVIDRHIAAHRRSLIK